MAISQHLRDLHLQLLEFERFADQLHAWAQKRFASCRGFGVSGNEQYR